MPRKKQSKRMMVGQGWLDDVWSGIKSVGQVAVPILKSTGVLGNLASSYNPALGVGVKSLGFGRKPKRSVIGAGKKVIKA